MFKKTFLAYILLVSLLSLIAISCNLGVDDCGPFDDKFRTVDFEAGLKNISILDNPSLVVQYSTIETDTVEFNEFGLSLFPIGESYSINQEKHKSLSLISSAFACSPPIPVSEETITDIQIFSDKNFNPEYASGNNLAALFNVVVLYRKSGYQLYDLNEFLKTEPKVPDEIFLLLKSAPETLYPIRFTIHYYQDGINMHSFKFTSEPLVITN